MKYIIFSSYYPALLYVHEKKNMHKTYKQTHINHM